MIVYNLGCANSHGFEGWFSSAEDFERQAELKLLSCPLCGSADVSRLPHAPYVNTRSAEPETAPHPGGGSASGLPVLYANLAAESLAAIVDKVLESTEDVGRAFPEEARKIHYGETPERHIRGVASTKEVDALREEGIEVIAVPVPPHRLSRPH